MTAKPLTIQTFQFFKMYKFIVESYQKDLNDALKHNLRYADRMDMQIVVSSFPYEGLLDYIRKTLVRMSENDDVIYLNRRGRTLLEIKRRNIQPLIYTHPL